jgi:uncharacterized protein YndB with AHSA1/START domain
MMEKIKGQTKTAGFQFGIRRTLPVSLEEAWEFIFSPKGIKIWLGDIQPCTIDLDKSFRTKDGKEGRVRILKPFSHIRMTLKKQGWENVSTLQIRFIRAVNKTRICFHQENLLDYNQRIEVEKEWKDVISELSIIFY